MSESYSITARMKPYIQPFERQLALREVEALAAPPQMSQVEHSPDAAEYRFVTSVPPEELAEHLAYWEWVATEEPQWPRQILREATVTTVREVVEPRALLSVLPFRRDWVPLPNRRCLRYGPHAVHEYKGKFFPQLVRALINVARVPEGGTILDPMCGSGTTLVESILHGCRAVGLDLNPLSTLISRTKCDILDADPRLLLEDYEDLRNDLTDAKHNISSQELLWLSTLPGSDQQYLARWFSAQVLTDLDVMTQCINKISHRASRDLFRLCLSNILRTASWQKTEDLRVRREIHSDAEIDAIKEFLNELENVVTTVVAFLIQEGTNRKGEAHVIEGDARHIADTLGGFGRPVDAVITSPPYATALPYLDTDRLSLCYLGLLSRPAHRARDHQMIGNREITECQRRDYWTEYTRLRDSLPREITGIVDKIQILYGDGNVGFRRRNLPSLLSRYFIDMRTVLDGIQGVVTPGGHIFVVVGDNHTIAAGQRIHIETAALLERLGESVGLEVAESIPMDMLVPRGIFRSNAVASEAIIHFIRG